MNGPLLLNSLTVALTTAVASVALGWGVALAALGSSPRVRLAWIAAAVVNLALPPFVVANSWLDVLGRLGVEALAPAPVSGIGLVFHASALAAVSGLLTLMFWPVAGLMIMGAWQRLEPALFEVEPLLRGGALVRWLLWPAARSTVALGLALVFVLGLNQFSIPALLQVKVFPVEVWVRFNTTFDAVGALLLSWPMVLVPAALLVLWRRPEVAWPRRQGGPPARLVRGRLGRGFWCGATATAGAVVLLALGVPLVQLLGDTRTWVELGPALRAGVSAVLHSLLLAGGAATLVLVVAGVVPRHGWLGLFWLAFLVPGVLLGVLLIVLLNRSPFVAFYQSVGVVLLAWTIRFLAPGWATVALGMRAVDRDLRDAARLEGARGWSLFRLVSWPQAGGSFLAAWYIVYLLCLWDTETLVLIMPPGGETLAVRIFNLLHYGHNAQVNALCLTLLALAVLPLAMVKIAGWGFRVANGQGQRGGGGHAPGARGRRPGGGWWAVGLTGLWLGTAGCSGNGPGVTPLQSRLFSSVQIIGSRGAGLGQFNKPRSVAVDAQDNLYVVDMTGRVQRFSPDGALLGYWLMPETDLGKAKGMCRDERGNIVVLEPHYARVNHFAPEGRLVEQWGRRGTNVGELTFPRAVAVAPDGRTYISEYLHQERVQVFLPGERRCERVFGSAGRGTGQFNRAEGLALDSAGRVYVADSCNHRIQVFEADGRNIRAYGRAGSGPGELSYPYDVQVDAQGRQYVCEFGNSRIQVFDAKAHLLEIVGGPGAGPGRFSNPWSLALDSKGNLYVADSLNHRVQKFIRRLVGG